MAFSQYTTKRTAEIFELLNGRETGLSEKEAAGRREIYGLNEVKIQEIGPFDILIRQFKSPFFYLLFIASAIAFSIGEFINGLAILFFVLINVCLGFFQEARAEKAANLLKKYIPAQTRVLREDGEKIIEQRFLVPGDVVLLEAGNIAPADLRVLKTENFLVDEEVLTGESAPVGKISQPLSKETKEIFEAKNIVFGGTSAVSGEAEGIVVSTGRNTVFGEIAKLTTQVEKESVYEKNLSHFSRLVLNLVVATILVVFILNLIIKGTADFFDFLIFCIALVVSIIPEALPTVVTFALSQGAIHLAKKKVVVKRLSAIEDLGNIEILCSDKTGTLTENKLTLAGIYSPDKEKCLLYGLLASSFFEEEIESSKNPFDVAIFEKSSHQTRQLLSNFKEISEVPFDSFRLKNSVLLEDKSARKILIVRGAPEIILSLSSGFEGVEPVSFPQIMQEIKSGIEKGGREGKRVLAVAYKEFRGSHYSEADEKDLTFLGYFSFIDPLKKTAKEAVALSKKLGVQIKILTGDSFEVAGAVAKEIGLIKDASEVILGETLGALSGADFEKTCEKFQVFARISPQTKYRIVEVLEKKFEVGFLGEGINDAPALKIANVAIAVKEGADISREVSDIILLKKDLRVIVDGIKNGRNIFSNINKYIKCTLASNFGNFYSIAAISLFIPFLPMLPVQILLVNLLSDFPLIAVATDRVDAEELRKPKFYQLHQIIYLIIYLALVSTVFDFIFFFVFHKAEPALLQTLWFIESILTEIALIFSIRTRRFFLKARSPSFPLIFFSFLAVSTTALLPFTRFGRDIFNFVSPPGAAFLTVVFLVAAYFIVSETIKLLYFRHFRHRKL